MRYLSVCSGIEAASVAWHPLGWQPVAFAEIEKFPSAVLAHHYPAVPNWGDITKFREWPDAAVDLLVGGTPCQSFSVAALRKGLADPRGNLALVTVDLLLIGKKRIAMLALHQIVTHAHLPRDSGPVTMKAGATDDLTTPSIFGRSMLLLALVVHQAKAMRRMPTTAALNRAGLVQFWWRHAVAIASANILGNCMRWLGQRIDMVEEATAQRSAA